MPGTADGLALLAAFLISFWFITTGARLGRGSWGAGGRRPADAVGETWPLDLAVIRALANRVDRAKSRSTSGKSRGALA